MPATLRQHQPQIKHVGGLAAGNQAFDDMAEHDDAAIALVGFGKIRIGESFIVKYR